MIQSLLKAMEVLEMLKNTNQVCTITEISEELELPPSTVHRILKTLASKLYVVQDERSHGYHLGPALMPLGTGASKHIHLQKSAYSVLREVAKKTGEDTFLVIRVENKGVVLERIDGPRTLKLVEEFGEELYLHYGAVRKSILAFQSEEFISQYIKNVIEGGKSSLKITPLELRETLKKIKSEGIATSSGDYAKGTIGVAAPIRNNNGLVIASIGVVAPKSKNMQEEKIQDLKVILKEAGELISKKIGYFG